MNNMVDTKITEKSQWIWYCWFCEKGLFWWSTKNINKKVTLNKWKHVEGEMKLNQLSEKVKLIKTKGYSFLLGRTYFTGDDGHQNFLVFTYMLNLLILDNNKKITN